MVSTIIPLITDKLCNICSSNNYRSIALSSLIIKVFDWVNLLLHGDKLTTDELQFGYQKKTSANMCSWLAIETIEHFLRNGSEYVGVMDMTKAFDNVQQSTLFLKPSKDEAKNGESIWRRSSLMVQVEQQKSIFSRQQKSKIYCTILLYSYSFFI